MQSSGQLITLMRGVVRQIVLLLALFVILFATYIALGRQFLPVLSKYRQVVELELGARLGVDLRIGALEGQWLGYEPEVRLHDVQLITSAGVRDAPSLSVSGLSLQLDILRTLRDWQPVFRRVRIAGTSLELQEQESGWSLPNMHPDPDDSADKTGTEGFRRVLDWVLSQRDVVVSDIRLQLQPKNGPKLALRLAEATMANAGERHWLDGQAVLEGEGMQGRLRLRIESEGDPLDPGNFSADIYIAADEFRLERRLELEGFEALAVKSMEGQAQVWGYVRDGRLDYAVGQLALPRSTWDAGRGRLEIPIRDGGTEFVATLDRTGSFVAELRGLHFRWRDHSSRISRVRVALNRQAEELHLVSDRLALEPVNHFLLGSGMLSPNLQQIFADLSPRGELANIHLQWDLAEDAGSRLLLEANLSDVAVNAWKGAPDATALNGYLRATERGGQVDLDAANMGLGFPTLFSGGWVFDHLQARIAWKILPDEVQVASSLISAALQGTPVRARFGLQLPFDREAHDPALSLQLSLTDASLDLLPPLLPDHLLNEATTNWLKTALTAGLVRRAGYVYHGALGGDPDLHKQRSSLMAFDVEGIGLAFHPDWAPLENVVARIVGNPDEISVLLHSGRYLGAELSRARASLPIWGPDAGAGLQIQGEAHAGMADFRDLLLQTPLRAHVPATQLETWQFSGQASALLDLTIPLGEGVELAADVRLRPDGATLGIPVGGRTLDFDRVRGELGFRLGEGLRAEGLQARLWGHRATGSIQTVAVAAGQQTTIRLSGRFAADKLASFTDQPILTFLDGESAYRARLDLFPDGRAPQLRVDSSLKGIAIRMPAPLAKPASRAMALQFRMELGEPQHMSLQLGELLAGRFLIEGGVLSQGRLQFGGGKLPLPQRGIEIGGQLAALNLEAWLGFIPKLDTRLRPAVGGEEASALVSQVALTIDQLDLWGYSVENSTALLKPAEGGWEVSLRNSMLALQASIPEQPAAPFGLHFEYLRIPEPSPQVAGLDPLAAVNPAEFPAMGVAVDEFRIGAADLGRWSFQARPLAAGVRVSSIRGRIRHADVESGSMDWLQETGKQRVQLNLNLEGKNIADVMKAWDYAPTLDSKKARLNLNLQWSGSPAAFDLRDAEGELGLKLEHGQLYDVDPRTSALRVFGVLNINTLARRLRLDFSDLFRKGLSYDKVQGSFGLKDGVLHAQGGLSIEGPSTKIHLTGDANLRNETLDQKMIVTLPVTSNLPLAALIAGQPAVAGAIWLTEKLLGDRLERFASAQYTVQGPWAEPEVKLDRVFSNKD